MITNYSKTFILTLFSVLLPICADAQGGPYNGENVPITFYGKVIDQQGQPLPGAKVSLLVIITHYSVNSGERKALTLETDQNGQFVVTGITGHAIDKISIEKEGYELSKKARRNYLYSFVPDYHPDATNPVIFKMWKKQGKEPLIGSAWHGKVAGDGTTNRFDLFHGRHSTDGSLEIVCTRTPSESPPSANARFHYKFELAIVGGGIQPTGDEFTYLAPESAYKPSFTVEEKADDPKWRPDVTQEFYIKTPDGHYGRLFIVWYAWQTPTGHCEWDCSINPSGSRNLER